MRLLLDECLTARLGQHLPGHEARTVKQMGWAGIKNGRLLRLIGESRSFDVFVTMDKSLPHQQDLRAIVFAVVVLRAPSNRYEDTRPLMPELLSLLPKLQPGSVIGIPGPRTAGDSA